jgi:hypothetical protein
MVWHLSLALLNVPIKEDMEKQAKYFVEYIKIKNEGVCSF